MNNVINLYGYYEVYFQGVYVATCLNRSSASKLIKALQAQPNVHPDKIIAQLKDQQERKVA